MASRPPITRPLPGYLKHSLSDVSLSSFHLSSWQSMSTENVLFAEIIASGSIRVDKNNCIEWVSPIALRCHEEEGIDEVSPLLGCHKSKCPGSENSSSDSNGKGNDYRAIDRLQEISLLAPNIPPKDEGVNSDAAPAGISWLSVAFGLANAAIGVGILNYPYTYVRVGGINMATLIQVLLILALMLSMFIIIYCADINKSNSYHEVLSSICGPKAQLLVAGDIAVATYGICVAYLIIIGDQYDRIFASLIGSDFCSKWYLDRKFTITVTAFFIFPICYLKRLDFLRHTGPLGIFAMLYVVFLTVYQHYTLDVVPGPLKTGPDSAVSVLALIPVICFGYQCNEVIVPIYASMKVRNIKNFMKAAVLAWVVLIALYCTVGTFGYKTFGSKVAPNIMQMFDARDPIVLIGIVALIFKMAVTYPQMSFCGRGAFEGLYQELTRASNKEIADGGNKRRIVTTSVWFLSTLFLSLFAPHIGIVIELLGSLAAVNVFIFPSLCLIFLAKRKDLGHGTGTKSGFVIVAFILIPIGISIFILVLYQVYEDILKATVDGSKSLCTL